MWLPGHLESGDDDEYDAIYDSFFFPIRISPFPAIPNTLTFCYVRIIMYYSKRKHHDSILYPSDQDTYLEGTNFTMLYVVSQ